MEDLLIAPADYVRDNPVDRQYRRRYKLRLYALSQNKCAICNSMDQGDHLDHFYVPKSKGGNFALKTTTGLWVNNAALLCGPHNLQKSDADPLGLYPSVVLEHVARINSFMTTLLRTENFSPERDEELAARSNEERYEPLCWNEAIPARGGQASASDLVKCRSEPILPGWAPREPGNEHQRTCEAGRSTGPDLEFRPLESRK